MSAVASARSLAATEIDLGGDGLGETRMLNATEPSQTGDQLIDDGLRADDRGDFLRDPA